MNFRHLLASASRLRFQGSSAVRLKGNLPRGHIQPIGLAETYWIRSRTFWSSSHATSVAGSLCIPSLTSPITSPRCYTCSCSSQRIKTPCSAATRWFATSPKSQGPEDRGSDRKSHGTTSPLGDNRERYGARNTVKDVDPSQKMGIYARFKATYKEHGKVLVCVHVFTSCFWYGGFYLLARSGIDIMPLLDYLGAGEKLKSVFLSYGNFAIAYALYKIATPARYSVTLAGTFMTLQQLRKTGYLKPVPEGDTFRELMKDGKSQIGDRVGEKRGEVKDKLDDMKEDFKDKIEDWKDRRKPK